jgi:DNA mismatch endonuclease (patch repair protein)
VQQTSLSAVVKGKAGSNRGGEPVADVVSPARRSQLMGRIRGKDTKPELIVRSAAHRLGYRFRLHVRNLPGSPDLVFRSRNVALFVHGCFWHRHDGCRSCYDPKSNIEFWNLKFRNNVTRDQRVCTRLEEQGWRVAIIWECETANSDSLRKRLKELLST